MNAGVRQLIPAYRAYLVNASNSQYQVKSLEVSLMLL